MLFSPRSMLIVADATGKADLHIGAVARLSHHFAILSFL
jgi:hypothetical protein